MRAGLYHLLRNPVYIGKILHRENTYPGQHEAILDQQVWDQVQALLKENAAHHSDVVQASDEESFLKGLLFDDRGNPIGNVGAAAFYGAWCQTIKLPASIRGDAITLEFAADFSALSSFSATRQSSARELRADPGGCQTPGIRPARRNQPRGPSP